MSEVVRDWSGEIVAPATRFLFAIDDHHLHYRVRRPGPATVHPSSLLASFQAELWKYDVAEFFLRNPETGHYLEINLAPNGGWWSCLFTAPLVRLSEEERAAPEVSVEATCNESGWDARISIPLDYLRKTVGFGPKSRLHAAFILDAPQRFLTTGIIPPGEPNFHHPDLPQPITITRP